MRTFVLSALPMATRRLFTTVSAAPRAIATTTTIGTKVPTPRSPYIAPLSQRLPRAERTVQAWVRDFRSNAPIGIAQLARCVFATHIRPDIVHRVVVYHLAKKRGVVQYHDKNRAEVRGSGRKIRPQKRLGRARVGDRRSPLFRGGGRAFPRRTRDFSIQLNSKIRDLGMRCALSSKYAQGQLILLGGGGSRMEELLKIGGEENSSSIDDTLAQVLSDNGWTKYGAKSLIVCEDGKVSDQSAAAKTEQSKSTVLQGDKFKVVTAGDLSVYDIVCHDHLFLTQKAVDYLERRYGAY